MTPSINVIGLRTYDDRFNDMKKVRDACIQADIPLPIQVKNYFHGDEEPGEFGATMGVPFDDWKGDDGRELGVTIELAKLPAGVTHLRCYIVE